MSIWDGFRNRLGSTDAKEKQSSPPAPTPASSSRGRQDVEWNSNLERKLKGVLHQLKVLTKIRKTRIPSPAATTSTSPPTAAAATSSTAAPAATAAQAAAIATAADPAVEAQSKRVGDAIKEVLPALALPSFSYETRGRGSSHHHQHGEGSSGGLSAARRFFLDLWHLLMINLEALEGKHQKHAYEAISYLITREEFDLHRMGLHLDQLRCSKDELLVVHRYRVLLFHTQTLISVKLSEVAERPYTPPYYFSQFCARVLAITFFRLPGVSRALIQAVALSTPQLAELEAYLIPLQRPPAAARLPIGDHRPLSPVSSSSPPSSSPPSSSSSPSPTSLASSPPGAATNGAGPSSPPMSFVSPSSTARSASHAIRIGATKADGGAASGTAAAAAGATGLKHQQERRVDSPRIGARRPDSDSATRRGAEEERERGDKGEETKKPMKRETEGKNEDDDRERHEHESEEEAEENENDENGDNEGDGRSARKYTFTQGRCYWLVTQLDGGQKTAKRKETGPVSPTLGRNTLSAFPNLTTWHIFHGALLTRIADNEDDKLRLAPTEWLKLFRQRDRLYFIFLRDWVDHILYNTQGRPLEWSGIKGYIPFLLGFIYELRARKHLTKPLLDCTNAFLATDPSLLNLFVKLTFTRTKLYDPMAVADVLSCLEAWLEQFRADERQVPPSFDHAFLIESLELILSTEHHQLLLKVLMFLYQYSEVFMGDARIALYSDFVLDRHFYYFFLHWDINVRNAFHQLLAYKMLRTKRSHLQGQGLRVKELASVRNNGGSGGSNGNSPNSRRPQAASTLIDREQAVDVMLFEKMEDKLKTAGNQMRGLVQDCYPASWEVYVPVALTEYKRYMAQYYQARNAPSPPPHWEGSDKKQPRMMPVAMVERTPPPVPILAQPRPRASMDGPDI